MSCAKQNIKRVLKVCKQPDCRQLFGCFVKYKGEHVKALYCKSCQLSPDDPNCSYNLPHFQLLDLCPECRGEYIGEFEHVRLDNEANMRREKITMSQYFTYLFFGAVVSFSMAMVFAIITHSGNRAAQA